MRDFADMHCLIASSPDSSFSSLPQTQFISSKHPFSKVMHLYNLKLSNSTLIQKAISGNFLGKFY